MILGLMVVGRRDRPWQGSELTQLEGISETLAIACLLDRRQVWYRQQAHQQLTKREIERDRLDDLFHQLRNPLTALKTFSQLLRRYLLGDAKGQSVADSLLRESDRLEDLIRQFEARQAAVGAEPLTLDLSATAALASGSDPTLNLQSVDVWGVLMPILTSAVAIAQNHDISLTWQGEQEQTTVWGDSQALTEALTNLIDNAIKYTPTGGQVEVKVGQQRTIKDCSYLGIQICDTGYGIPSSHQSRIFERHYRGSQAIGVIAGTGLGLAIAKEAIEHMAGMIELQSPNPYRHSGAYPGTCFTVWLAVHKS
jgi:signal transduction histidine kinase